jgi:sugar phosphate isomerase/epimerase
VILARAAIRSFTPPATMPIVSLDHLTLLDLTPPELVRIAGLAGFTHVGVRLNPAAPGEYQYPMLGDSPMLCETVTRMRDTGVRVLDFGVVRLNKTTDVRAFEPIFESAARLGASHAMVNGDEPDHGILAALLARLCEVARPFGLTMNLEATPWSGVRTLADAVSVVQAADQPEARVLVDTIHVDRSGGTPADIAEVPAALITHAQICDAYGPRPHDFETMIFQARNERRFPGEGNLDMTGMLRALPPGIALSLEAPCRTLARTLSPLELAKRGRAAVESLLASLE